MKVRRIRSFLIVALIAAAVALSERRGDFAPPKPETATVGSVQRVIDGDTVMLENGERVRLIGIDTPETKDPRKPVQYFGEEAAAFTRSFIERKQVRLEFDQTRQDRYGRTLAYVFRVEDGAFLNLELVRRGFAHALTKYPFGRMDEFRAAEKEARENQRGLWAAIK